MTAIVPWLRATESSAPNDDNGNTVRIDFDVLHFADFDTGDTYEVAGSESTTDVNSSVEVFSGRKPKPRETP